MRRYGVSPACALISVYDLEVLLLCLHHAYVHNNRINFQKIDGVLAAMGQLTHQGSGLTIPAGGCSIVALTLYILNINL